MTDRRPGDRGGSSAVGVIRGDRLCIRCGFNLHGQQIVREEHYDMLAVRCPECSTVASLQEYPTLGTWTRRFWAVLALAWLVLLLAAGLLSWLSVTGTAEWAAQEVTLPARKQLMQAFDQYAQVNYDDDTNSPFYRGEGNIWWSEPDDDWLDPQWVADQGLAAARQAPSPLAWTRLGLIALPLVGSFFWGVLFSTLLLERRFVRRPIAVGLIVAAAIAFSLSTRAAPTGAGNWMFAGWSWGVAASEAASRLFGLAPAIAGAVLCGIAMFAGARWGRSIVRGLLRILLPPFLRGSLGILWHVDGLPSPSTRHEMWRRG